MAFHSSIPVMQTLYLRCLHQLLFVCQCKTLVPYTMHFSKVCHEWHTHGNSLILQTNDGQDTWKTVINTLEDYRTPITLSDTQ